MAMAQQEHREKPIPEFKLKAVDVLAKKFSASRTIMVVSTKGLPASQFQKIKKGLLGRAEIMVAKKSSIMRALDKTERGALHDLKQHIVADIALIFSDIEAFELASVLVDSQSPTKAKAGDIAPEDIVVEPGPTDLTPGPAISELGSVGLKVAVEDGKLSIRQGATIVKEGEVISEKVSGVMAKLNILPMKVGFIPLAAFDAESGIVYAHIKIDKVGALAELRTSISKALGFAVNVGYVVKETLSYFISKAAMEYKVLEAKVGGAPAEESTSADAPSEVPAEEKKESDDANKDKEVA